MLRDRLLDRLLKRERSEMQEMVALYQSSLRVAREDLERSTEYQQDLHEQIHRMEHQLTDLQQSCADHETQVRALQERLDVLLQRKPSPIALPRIGCVEEGCNGTVYRSNLCFHHYCQYWINGGDSL